MLKILHSATRLFNYSLPRTVSSFFGVQRTDNAGCAHKTIGQRTNVLN